MPHEAEFTAGDLVQYTGAWDNQGGRGWIGRVTDIEYENVEVDWIEGPLRRPSHGVFPGNISHLRPWDQLVWQFVRMA